MKTNVLRIGILWSDFTWTEELVPCEFSYNTSMDKLSSFATEWGRENRRKLALQVVEAWTVWFVPLEVVERG